MNSENSNTIRVILRSRPTQNFATKNIVLDSLENMITINVPKLEEKGLINNQKESWNFKFDKILHNVSQEEVFEYSSKEIIQKAIEGFNGTIFAYGQTGSGKTFTMSGSPNNYNYRGVIPRSITRTFQEIGGKPEYEFIVKISYLEIYNETLYDLLSPIPTQEQKGDISLQEDSKGNLNIKGLSKHIVNNEEEAFNLLFEGEANRTISEHQLNKESTRSHCIFTIYLEMKSRIESSEKVITSKLNFVDLAGSERVKKTGSTGIILKEANYINKSLTFLEQVVVALTDKKRSRSKDHIPYRQSKLTHLLKDSIGGNCRTVMIATMWPEENHINETLSTLNFARRMMNVVNEASVNIQLDTQALLRKYAKEIKELKQELAMHNTLANRERISYESYTPEEQYSLQITAKNYLTNVTKELDFESVRQAKELFNQCKILFQKVWVNKESLGDPINEGNKLSSGKLLNINKQKSGYPDDGSGELEIKPSFGLGTARKDARPINKLEISSQNIAPGSDNEEEKNERQGRELEEKTLEQQHIEGTSIPDKNTAFAIFKNESSISKEIEGSILQNSEDLKKRKNEARDYLENCNNYKNKIEIIKISLNEKKLNKLNLGDEMSNVIDEEECKLINDLKEIKDCYKEVLEKFKHSKVEIAQLKSNLEVLKLKYVENFENWFYDKYGIRIHEHNENEGNKTKYGNKNEFDDLNNKEIDEEEQAYFNAKKKVLSIHKAKKMDKIKK